MDYVCIFVILKVLLLQLVEMPLEPHDEGWDCLNMNLVIVHAIKV